MTSPRSGRPWPSSPRVGGCVDFPWIDLETLSQEAGEAVDDSLTKAEAWKRIDELQQQTGLGA